MLSETNALPITSQLNTIFESQTYAFNQIRYPSLKQRKQKLLTLKKMLLDHQNDITHAIKKDFGHRAEHETKLLEIFPAIESIKHALKHIRKWMKPKRRRTGLWFLPAKNYIFPQPLGVVGIIVPWNYPLFLAMCPLTQAIAAGNNVMIKMSEFTPCFSELFKKLIAANFPQEEITVVTGEVEVAKAFTALPFDHLLFTGSTEVGKQVMRAASEHLTPVTLELGGKSPTIIGHDANPKEIKRIIIGKLLNAGQTCVAPDYVFIPKTFEDKFVQLAIDAVKTHYPEIHNNKDYTHIINQQQNERLTNLLNDAIDHGAKIIELSPIKDIDHEKFLPRLLLNVNDKMKIMHQEIFGPLMPVLTYDNLDEAIEYINQRPRPLALYYFGKNSRDIDKVLLHTHAGGVVINDTLIHAGEENLPFGGIGASGMGHYHGLEGFKTFSKMKPVFMQHRFSSFSLLYPPYGKLVNMFMKLLIR